MIWNDAKLHDIEALLARGGGVGSMVDDYLLNKLQTCHSENKRTAPNGVDDDSPGSGVLPQADDAALIDSPGNQAL